VLSSGKHWFTADIQFAQGKYCCVGMQFCCVCLHLADSVVAGVVPVLDPQPVDKGTGWFVSRLLLLLSACLH